jgi:hypothetical protein
MSLRGIEQNILLCVIKIIPGKPWLVFAERRIELLLGIVGLSPKRRA